MRNICVVCNKPFKYPISSKRKQFTCSLKCRSIRWKREKIFKEANNPGWKGGKTKYPDGYIIIKKPEHPFADKNGYVREHRLIMEKYLGRYLQPNEVIHHKNHIRDDNRLENLELFNGSINHLKTHYPKGRQVAIPS